MAAYGGIFRKKYLMASNSFHFTFANYLLKREKGL